MKSVKVRAPKRVETSDFVEIEVFFPIYRKHTFSGDNADMDTYTRIEYLENEFREVTIQRNEWFNKSDPEWELEFNQYRLFPDKTDDPDYLLGRGKHTLTKEEFEVVLVEFKAVVAAL